MKIIDFFKTEIWKETDKYHPFKRFIYSFLRISISTIQGFIKDNGFEKASILTYYSLLSIVPIAAIGFGIAQHLGFEEKFAEQVKNQLSGQPEIANKIIQFSLGALKQTKGGIIAGLGIITLLWTVLSLIGSIEKEFDEIWKVKKTRTLWQQVKSYIPLIIIFPIFLVASSGLLLYASSKAILVSQSFQYMDIFTPWLERFFGLLQYLLNCSLLCFLYIYLPNTKVRFSSGIKASIVAAILFYIWQWIYLTFQVKASGYGAIYGSFAAIPLFLIWLNYSWTIILFGSELSYQLQNKANNRHLA